MGGPGLKRCMTIECCTQDTDPNQTPCIDHSGRRGGCHIRLLRCTGLLSKVQGVSHWCRIDVAFAPHHDFFDARVSPSFQ